MPGLKGSVAERKARTQQILDLHQDGLTNKQIAERLGFVRHYVYWVLKREGLRFNGHGQTKVPVADDGTVACKTCGERSPVGEHKRSKGYVTGICRSCRNKQRQRNRNDNIFAYRTHSIRSACKKKGIPFDLTAEYLRKVYTEQNGLCFYTDRPMQTTLTGNGPERFQSLSVDRIVPEYGYTQGNVVLCVLKANVIKNDLSLREIREWLPGWYARIEQHFFKELAA
jgi:hypothetical protein